MRLSNLLFVTFALLAAMRIHANPSVLIFSGMRCHYSSKAVEALQNYQPLVQFSREHKVVLISSLDLAQKVREYNVISFPTYVFLDEQGRESWRDSGFTSPQRLQQVLLENFARPDQLPGFLHRLAKDSSALNLYIAGIQLIGRGRFTEAIQLIYKHYSADYSDLERASINSLLYRAIAAVGQYDVLVQEIEKALKEEPGKWESTGQLALDALFHIYTESGEWATFFEHMKPVIHAGHQFPEFLGTLSRAYLSSGSNQILGYHYARQAFSLAEKSGKLDVNHYYLLRNWSKSLHFSTRQKQLEDHILKNYGVDVSKY